MKMPSFKTKKNFKKGGFHVNPHICWEVVIYIAFAIILMSFVFGFYLFKQINKDFVASEENSNTPGKTVKRERIEKVLEYFSEREKKSAQILNSPPPIPDPSR